MCQTDARSLTPLKAVLPHCGEGLLRQQQGGDAVATVDQSKQRTGSPVEADRPGASFVALIGAALITVSALLTAVVIALGQQ
jgi:hypothetical protein